MGLHVAYCCLCMGLHVAYCCLCWICVHNIAYHKNAKARPGFCEHTRCWCRCSGLETQRTRSDALCWSISCKSDSLWIKMYLLDGHIFMTHFLKFMVAYNTLFLHPFLSFFLTKWRMILSFHNKFISTTEGSLEGSIHSFVYVKLRRVYGSLSNITFLCSYVNDL